MSNGDPKQGDTLDGRYVLEDEIGRGGHGIVFRARDTHAGDGAGLVAVKILRETVADDPQYTVRLQREAESLRALWGSSVVRVDRFATAPGGAVYLVMELLQGETLEERLLGLEDFGDRLSSFDLLTVLDPVARALHTAHTKGIVHRDVKPANVFLLDPESGGGVRLMDFGLAKVAGAEQLTQVGMIAGSPAYIAPEIWRSEAFDHRIDVYSLASLVFRCLAGAPPFAAPTPLELFMKATTEERPRLTPLRPDLSPEVDTWVARGLALRREDRYPYVSTMWNDLIRIVMNGRSPSAERARQAFRLPG